MMDLAGHSRILAWAVDAAALLIVLGLGCSFARLVKGPSLPDRVISVDVITVLSVAVVGLLAVAHDDADLLDVAVALALVAFLATLAFSWYAERRTEQRGRDRAAGGRGAGR